MKQLARAALAFVVLASLTPTASSAVGSAPAPVIKPGIERVGASATAGKPGIRGLKAGARSAKGLSASSAPKATISSEATTSIIVGFKNADSERAIGAATDMGARLVHKGRGGRFAEVRVKRGTDVTAFIARLERRRGVKFAEPNGLVHATTTSSDDPGFPSQWGLARIGAPNAWDVSKGASITVAVIDTGVSMTHPDLVGRVDTVNDYDFVNGDATAQDDEGHGTHVSGIIAATLNNGIGVAGVAPRATILPVKALDSQGSGDFFTVAQAIEYAADKGADVINMSLGSASYTSVLSDAVQYALAADCVVVAASGNDSSYGVNYPAKLSGVVGVGSTTSLDQRSSFSNYGPQVDVSAPGSDIYSTLLSGGYGKMSGTSMATPHVAGVVALIRSLHPTWNRSSVEQKLFDSAKDLGAAGRDDYYGYGRVDAAAAVDGTVAPPPVVNDDEIPGVAAGVSPIVGTLDEATDADDVYKIHLQAGQTLTMGLTGDVGTDFDLYLYSPSATSVNDTSSIVAFSQLSTYPEARTYLVEQTGDYYLDVFAYSGAGTYSLTYSVKSAFSADDDIPGVVAPGSPISGTLSAGSDSDDVYAVKLQAGQKLSVSLTGDAGTDFDAYLFAPDAVSVSVNEPVASAMSLNYPDTFSYTASVTGTYCIDVFAYAGTGAYSLDYSIAAADPDDDVPGVAFSASPQTGSVSSPSDKVDVYAVPVAAGKRLALGLVGPADADFDLYLFGPGTRTVYGATPVVGSNGTSSTESLSYVAPSSATYYVVVHAYSGGGDYSLEHDVAWASADDEVPGLSIAPSIADSLTGGVDGTDAHDVFSIPLVAGQWVYLDLKSSASDFDLCLWKPGTASVHTDPASSIAASSASPGSNEHILYHVEATGTYYADVYGHAGRGLYTLSYGLPDTQPTLHASAPGTIPYNGSGVVSGTILWDSGVASRSVGVSLYRGTATGWEVAATSATDLSGHFTFNASPASRTAYRVGFGGDEALFPAESEVVTVAPQVYVRTPIAPSTVYHSRYYAIYGSLKPRHNRGTQPVRIYRWRKVAGVWRSYGYVKATASDYSTYTRYSARMRLSTPGKWRLRAYAPSDSAHAATWSGGYDYVTAR